MGIIALLLFYALLVVFIAFCWARIARRLGYEGAGLIGFLMLIPVVNQTIR